MLFFFLILSVLRDYTSPICELMRQSFRIPFVEAFTQELFKSKLADNRQNEMKLKMRRSWKKYSYFWVHVYTVGFILLLLTSL